MEKDSWIGVGLLIIAALFMMGIVISAFENSKQKKESLTKECQAICYPNPLASVEHTTCVCDQSKLYRELE
jgi:hypothetical protein